MAAGAEAMAALPEEWRLYFVPTRIATFRNWPFTEDCTCTPERMAAAGFLHCPVENGPDVAQCFFCFKELEGWEPEDDPLEEHKKHSASCAFLSLRKDPTDLTMQEFLKLDRERMKNAIKKEISQKMTEVEDTAKKVHHEIEDLVS
ncbi:baculoviral IAP repeat-containing protein 5 [Falco naumanni]|uniref:Baculoviral IAP repeat containing 5 n=1 Tax=Falco tinnunculus TaxID=100819 RepID=A0A8C4ULZ7_FALTI|nr:baculoviral IAP repeat-containing protein 5 [Falco naumanni]